jgi:hypothetical protein
MRTKHQSDAAFESWVGGADQLRTHSVQAAFRAGWEARETAPNTLVLDTTHAQRVPIPNNSAAAPAARLRLPRRCPRCNSLINGDGTCPRAESE